MDNQENQVKDAVKLDCFKLSEVQQVPAKRKYIKKKQIPKLTIEKGTFILIFD